jgi:DNA-binding MarR family transcriptional regulator
MLEQKDHGALTPWICQISRLSSLFVAREMGNLGFGTGQFFFLSELYQNEGLSQDELSDRVGVDKSNTSRALARLEKYGFIRREPDPKNHRVKKIFLESKAGEICEALQRIQHRWNTELLDGLSEKKKAELLLNLKKMARNAAFFLRENRT